MSALRCVTGLRTLPMNMLNLNQIKIDEQSEQITAEMIFAVEAVSTRATNQKQQKAKELLDCLFPLDNGSHRDVTSYVVDYHHVMAYFKDGSHSGLKFPKQFVGYNGSKDRPQALLFRDEAGSHIEIDLGCCQGTGCLEFVQVEDIQLETQTILYAQGSAERGTTMRHWISLVRGDDKGKPAASLGDKEFTAKNGDDYHLSYFF